MVGEVAAAEAWLARRLPRLDARRPSVVPAQPPRPGPAPVLQRGDPVVPDHHWPLVVPRQRAQHVLAGLFPVLRQGDLRLVN